MVFLELGIFFDPANRKTVRNILSGNGVNGTTFATPYVKDQKLSLCSLDEGERRKAVDLVKKLAGYAAETGYSNFGVPSGDDPGPVFRGLAKNALAESMMEIADYIIYKMERGVTLLQAQGWYTKKPREVLMILISQKELPSLNRVIKEIDPKAFMSISNTNNVYGEGFEEMKTGVKLTKKKQDRDEH